MPRLIAFGCSYTWGVGLPDVYPVTGNTPSKFAWPALLSTMLDRELCNEAIGGSGNAEIFDKILRYQFEPDDLVMIMWSHFVRYDSFTINSNYTQHRRTGWSLKNIDDLGIHHHNAYKNYITMQHCGLLLLNKGIKSFSFIGFTDDTDQYPVPNFITIPNSLTITENYWIDRALDNSHFGEKSQAKLANILYNRITQ